MKKSFRSIMCIMISIFILCSVYVGAEGGDETAYHLVITDSDSFYALSERAELTGADIKISFDYYLCNSDSSAALANLASYETLDTLSQGWNSIAYSANDFSGGFCPGIRLNDTANGKNADLYLKNISIKVDGKEIFRQDATQYSNSGAVFEAIPENEFPAADCYLIDFSGTLPNSFYCISNDTWQNAKGNPIEVSFDYYIENAGSGELFVENVAGGGGFADGTSGSKMLKSGKNRFSYTTESYEREGFCVGIKATNEKVATNAKIYIWNVVITVDGKNYFNMSATQWYSKTPLPKTSALCSKFIPFEKNETFAYKIDFSGSGAAAYYCISNDTWQNANGKPVEVSFDYYIENANNGELFVENVAEGGGFADSASKSKLLKTGKNRFSYTTESYELKGFCVGIKVLNEKKPSNAKLYIWNVTVAVNGESYFNTAANQYYTKGQLPTFETLSYSDIDFKEKEVDRERPYEGNAAYLPYSAGEFTSPYDSAADELRDKILNLEDLQPQTSTVYYVSYRGNDSNNGLSKNSPWKTTSKLNGIKENSTVLFERGGVYRGSFRLKSNVTYAAYGNGAKPCIYGSPQNYASEGLWKKYSEDIWCLTVEGSEDVGSIIFDDGAKSAVRIIGNTSEALDSKLTRLTEDYMYIYQDGSVYLKIKDGNPGKIHYDIEITDRALAPAVLIGGYRLNNVTVENLCLKYGNFGISTSGRAENIVIRGCEIGYIGGCVTTDGIVRWGNGIEIWGPCNNITVESCWVYQCYDTGITTQCNEDGWAMTDIRFTENLVEFCQYAIESFNGVGQTNNQIFNKNILRFSGYQVYDPKSRHGSDSSYTSLICLPWEEKQYDNFVIEDNIFDTSYGYIIKGQNFNQPGGITCRNNSYFQQTGLKTYFFDKDNYEIYPSIARLEDGTLYTALSQYEVERGAAAIDTSPVAADYSLNTKDAAYRLKFCGKAGPSFYNLTEFFNSDKALSISFDYYYSGSDNQLILVNASSSEIISEIKSGKNSVKIEYSSADGKYDIRIAVKDMTVPLESELFLNNIKILADGINKYDADISQTSENAPMSFKVYADEIPGYTEIKSDVYSLDFEGCSADSYYSLTNDPMATGKTVSVSFSYYLSDAENKELMVFNVAGGIMFDEITASGYLRNGRNKFSCETTVTAANRTFCLGIKTLSENSRAKLYIWDINITVGGVSVFNPNAKQWYSGKLPSFAKVPAGEVPYISDADNNGQVNIIDLVRLKKYLSNNLFCIDKINCDSDFNGQLNSADLVSTKQVLLQLQH